MEACQVTCAISTTLRRELSSSFFPARQGAEQNSCHSYKTLGKYAPSYATIKNWVAQFKRGDFSTCDTPYPGWPKTVTTHQIHELILKHRRISAKSIAEQLGISRERVGSIIHEDLDMRKLSAKWVPKCLNADEKCCLSTCGIFSAMRDPNDFLSRLVTTDETWLCHYDPETRQSDNQWSVFIMLNPSFSKTIWQ